MSFLLAFSFAIIAALTAGSAAAADSGWYVGLNAGSASADVGIAQFTDAHNRVNLSQGVFNGPGGIVSTDDSDVTWSVLGGYRLSRYFSVQAAYADLGEIRYHRRGPMAFGGGFPSRFPGPPLPPVYYPAESTLERDMSVATIELIGRLPITHRFDVHTQLGLGAAMADVRSTNRVSAVVTSERTREDESNVVGLKYGAGTAFHFNKRWTLSLDWQRYDVEDENGFPFYGETNYDAITLSVLFGLGAAD